MELDRRKKYVIAVYTFIVFVFCCYRCSARYLMLRPKAPPQWRVSIERCGCEERKRGMELGGREEGEGSPGSTHWFCLTGDGRPWGFGGRDEGMY